MICDSALDLAVRQQTQDTVLSHARGRLRSASVRLWVGWRPPYPASIAASRVPRLTGSVDLAEQVVKSPLRQATVDRQLAAFEPVQCDAFPRLLAFNSLTRSLALARPDAAA